MERIDLKGMTRAELTRWFVEDLGETAARADSVFQQIWKHGADDFASMEGHVAKKTRERLASIATLSSLTPDIVLDATDGTKKFLWQLKGGYKVESVLIPDGDRLTLCMSSQVGCAMGCTFCVTGDMGLKRQMTVQEIADQALQVQKHIGHESRITNIVMMGMGEPLHNMKALVPALTILLDGLGMDFSHRKVTVSTVGMIPKMAELADALPVNLAISINATTEEQRLQIMPITKKHSLQELVDAARAFKLPAGKRITFEYVMFAGFNDTLADAARLYDLLEGIPSKVNLIPYNENEHFRDLKCPDEATVKAFQNFFVSRGMGCMVRTTRGLDISAACGQLGRARSGGVVAAG